MKLAVIKKIYCTYIFDSPIKACKMQTRGIKLTEYKQNKKLERSLTWTMFLAIFLTVFITAATKKIEMNSLLAATLYMLVISLTFIYLVLRVVPRKLFRVQYTAMLAIVLGILAAAIKFVIFNSADGIVMIEAALLGFIAALIYYQAMRELENKITKNRA